MKRSVTSKDAFVTVLSLLAIAAVFLGCCGGFYMLGRKSDPAANVVQVDALRGHIRVPTEAIVCSDLRSHEEMHKAQAAEDHFMVNSLLLDGKAFTVADQTRVLILNPGAKVHLIQVVDGPMRDRKGYISAELVEQDSERPAIE